MSATSDNSFKNPLIFDSIAFSSGSTLATKAAISSSLPSCTSFLIFSKLLTMALKFLLAPIIVSKGLAIGFSYGPAKVFGLPDATVVHLGPTSSPILPQPLPLIKTVVDPVVIAA